MLVDVSFDRFTGRIIVDDSFLSPVAILSSGISRSSIDKMVSKVLGWSGKRERGFQLPSTKSTIMRSVKRSKLS